MSINKEFDFCEDLVRLYTGEFAEGNNGERFSLGGCSTINNLSTLKRIFESKKPIRSLEVGLCLGGSCLLFTGLHRKNGNIPNKQHTAIDPYQVSMWKEAGLLAVKRAELSSFLDFRENLSSLELPRLVSEKQFFDFIYIDGSHIFEDVFIDFYYTARILNHEGIVVFDDCTDAHVAKVISFIRKNLKPSFEEIDLGPFRLDGGKPLKYKTAKI